jgi:hypothetical protein
VRGRGTASLPEPLDDYTKGLFGAATRERMRRVPLIGGSSPTGPCRTGRRESIPSSMCAPKAVYFGQATTLAVTPDLGSSCSSSEAAVTISSARAST